MEITQAYLQELFHYHNGNLVWKINKGKRGISGRIAGCVNNKGYIIIIIDRKKYKSHRLVWLFHNGLFPKYQIDHINGIRTDNRIENLREATSQQNSMNTGIYISNTSGTKGVCWSKEKSKWMAYIKFLGKFKNLGYFDDVINAADARKKAEIELFGCWSRR